MIRVLIVIASLALIACNEKPEPEVATNSITVPQAFDALQRYYNVNKLCYDSIQGFLGHFPEKGEAGFVDDENHGHGWFVSNSFHFYKLSNGTWFITEPAAGETHNITPDVSNLQCRDITITP